MESQLVKLLTPLLPSLDDALVSYLASVASESGAKKWSSSGEVFDALGDLLESYEAVDNATQARAKCDEILKAMQNAGIIAGKAVAPKPAPTPAPVAAAPAPVVAAKAAAAATTTVSSRAAAPAPAAAAPVTMPQPGYTCQARYSGDGLFYAALVIGVRTVPVVRVRVRFTAYGDEEEVPLTSLKDVVPGVMPPPKPVGKRAVREAGEESDEDSDEDDSDDDDDDVGAASSSSSGRAPGKLLSNPIRIGEVGPSLAQLRLSEKEAAAIEAEKNLTPKELKLLQKRQAKAEKAARELEARRTWNPTEHAKMQTDALPIYLQSRHLSKKAGTKDIALDDVTLLSPDNTELLVNTQLRLNFARRYGLVGRNGIGKSTLLRQISSYTLPHFPTWVKIMHVEQEVVAENLSVLEVVMNADLERGLLVKEEAELNAKIKEEAEAATATGTTPSAELSDRLAVVYDRLVELESHTAQARASTILSGLQFTQDMQAMPTKALSGGWRMRVALACALFVSPDLLLLDEPTNHLDFPAVLWLQAYLQSYPKTVLIVSHDRVFLNAVITDTVHFTNKKRLEYFRGDYHNFVKVRAEKYKAEKRAYESQQMQRQHLQDFITTFKTEKKSSAQDRKVGQAMSKQKILDKMELLENPDIESTDHFSLKFPDPSPLRIPLIAEIKGLSFRYPKRELFAVEDAKAAEERRIKRQQGTLAPVATVAAPVDPNTPYLLEDISVRVEITSRVGIIGANGCGKSTLIKILLGELPVSDGSGLVWLNSNVSIAYFTQHHVDQLNLGLTAVQWLVELFPGTTAVECRRHLGKFGLIGDLTLMQIGNLSGGQKSRLAMAIICWRDPHMLIMDEPTNHLDMETIDVLIKAINEFKGAVLIISHDQHFLRGCLKEFWSIHDRKLHVFDNLDACKKATYKHIEE